ncbi:hypothetical protein ACFWCF_09900 [Rhodococcus sp. NPDC060090]|uniref:hypothetical protein n=1 Tax=Rhodococcus sp. NPDC060090 TaxID=3347056 RepID=UPI003661AE60
MTATPVAHSHGVITDIDTVTPDTPDDALVHLHVAARYVGHTVPYMRNMRGDDRGPLSSLRARRIVYRLGDLRDYNEQRFHNTKSGGSY